MQSTKLNKIRTFFAAVLLSLTLFSVLYTAKEQNHHCEGDGCTICFVLNVIEQSIKLLSITLALSFASVFLYRDTKAIAHFLIKNVIISNTLITQKIRIND